MKQLLLFVFSVLFFYSYAQTKKVSPFLRKELNLDEHHKTINLNKQELIAITVKGNVAAIKSIVEENGGKIINSVANIASVKIPLNKIQKLIESKEVQQISRNKPRPTVLNDTMVVKNNVIEVHNGQTPLPQMYDGDGVVIGIIDTEIDYTHEDFKNSDGTTRIKWIWDQKVSTGGTTPVGFGYGQEWDNTQIDAGAASNHNYNAQNGHGTIVSGIAAGNGRAVGRYTGVAPKADIIFVGLDFNYIASSTAAADAVEYIFAKADAMNKPCVINCSFGYHFGSHDGTDDEAVMIDNMVKAKNGRVVVASAGNSGNMPYHLGYEITADSSFTWFKYNSGFSFPPLVPGGGTYMSIWADTNNFKNAEFSIRADQVNPSYSYRGRIPYMNIVSHLNVLNTNILMNGTNRIGTVYSYAEIDTNTNSYHLEFLINPDSTTYRWGFITKGSGKFDCWSWGHPNSDNDLISSGLPDETAFPDIARYKLPDTTQTIMSSFQCLESVITVANYINKNQYTDVNNNVYTDPTITPNAIHPTSSNGPTRDGRLKPEIAATGKNNISAWPAALVTAAIGAGNSFIIGQGGKHVVGSGTSSSAPVISGVVALYLQRNPNASYQEVKEAITNTAKQDAFTGTVPNNTWGYGKVNAFAALTNFGTLITSSISPSSFCPGASLNVPYSGSNIDNTDNIISVELSDASGNFTNSTTIGTGISTGTITCSLPTTISAGSGYRVRTISTSPLVTSSDNGNNISVYSPPNVQITGNLQSSCTSGTTTLFANPVGIYQWSNGSTNSSLFISTAGTYSLIVTDARGCTNSSSVSVSVGINPTLTVTGNATICSGDSTLLSVAGASSYTWAQKTNIIFENQDSSVVNVFPSTSTYYTAIGKNAHCIATKATEIIVNPSPATEIFGTGLSSCVTGTAELIAYPIGKYLWSNGSTTRTITVSDSGDYWLKVTLNNACYNVDSIKVKTSINPTVTIVGNTTICPGEFTFLTATGSSSYSWVESTSLTIENEDSSVIKVNPSSTTTYVVRVRNGHCSGSGSAQVYVSLCTYIEKERSEQDPSIYPNPSKGYFWVDVKDFLADKEYVVFKLYNQLGQEIDAFEINSSQEPLLYDRELNDGLYTFFIVDKNNVILATGKLISQY